MKKLLFLGIFAFLSLSLFAQKKTCQTTEYMELLRKKNPDLYKTDDFEKWIKANKEQVMNARRSGSTMVIPVVVHVVHIGGAPAIGSRNIPYEQVVSQIRVLNEDYNRTNHDKAKTRDIFNGNNPNNYKAPGSMNIEFKLADIDPDGNIMDEPGVDRIDGLAKFGKTQWDGIKSGPCTTEDILKPQTSWDSSKYLNIWVLKFVPGSNNSVLLGYALFPHGSTLTGLGHDGRNATNDGLVINYKAFGSNYDANGNQSTIFMSSSSTTRGRTTTHEMGHFLGLRHIWGDESGCSNSDYCADTPSATGPNGTCNPSKNSCNSTEPVYGKDTPDMLENYMDYSSDHCMNLFTNDQVTRMETVLAKADRIKDLKNSKVFITKDKVFAGFKYSPDELEVGADIQFKSTSTAGSNTTIDKYEWNFDVDRFESNNNKHTGETPPLVQFNKAGKYTVSLKVYDTNKNLSNTMTKELTVIMPIPRNLEVVNARNEKTDPIEVENQTELKWTLLDANYTKVEIVRINVFTKIENVIGEVDPAGPFKFVDDQFNEQDQLSGSKSFAYKVVASNATSEGESDAVDVDVFFTRVTAIDEKLSSQVSVYPNPNEKNDLYIDLSTIKANNFVATVYNSIGNVVATHKLDGNVSKLDISNYTSGLYLIVIETEEGTIRKKLMVK